MSSPTATSFGVTADSGALSWSTAHGELHRATITSSGCQLLDWEPWAAHRATPTQPHHP
ncbi:MAG: hypothetical protein JO268_03130, partial [Pseudonocardiales bacterium]|nr:hypothetical protein [Pseudonocardiales bacterium]